MTSVRYITGDELKEIIKGGTKDYLVVDVRDEDFAGGNITGALNAPSETFLSEVHDLVAKTQDVKRVVFHCALSQVRGPKAARIYVETRGLLQNEGRDTEHEVLVLRGGFTEFQAKFRKDPELVENWSKVVWDSPYTY